MFDYMEELNKFNFADYLKRRPWQKDICDGRPWVGQVDPWRKYDDGKPIMALLTPVENALEECVAWSGQDMTREQFIKVLRNQGVLVFKNVDEFAKLREHREKEAKAEKKARKTRRKFSEAEIEKRRNQMALINEMKKASVA
jgi:hypothetical protein